MHIEVHARKSKILTVIVALACLVTEASLSTRAKNEVTESPQRWRGIQALFFLNSKDGWLVDLDDENALRLTSTLYGTDNGGQDWKIVGHLPFPPSRIRFIDPVNGWVTSASANSIASTSDGGATWKTFSSAARLDRGQDMSSGEELIAYSKQSSWVVLKNQLLTTTDGGLTWERHPDLEDIRSATRASEYVGFALTADATICRTEDRGEHWARLPARFVASEQTLREIPNQNASGRIRFSDGRHGWLILWAANQANALLFGTDDGGLTWLEKNLEGIPSGESALVYDVQLYGHSGWMIANTLRDNNGIIQKYYVLRLNDGRWISCGSAETRRSIRMFAGVPPNFAFVLEGNSKLVRFGCKEQPLPRSPRLGQGDIVEQQGSCDPARSVEKQDNVQRISKPMGWLTLF